MVMSWTLRQWEYGCGLCLKNSKYIYCHYLIKDANGLEVTVVLLDSEGIDDVSGEGADDHCIFTLTILLSSMLIYNSAGVPTRTDRPRWTRVSLIKLKVIFDHLLSIAFIVLETLCKKVV